MPGARSMHIAGQSIANLMTGMHQRHRMEKKLKPFAREMARIMMDPDDNPSWQDVESIAQKYDVGPMEVEAVARGLAPLKQLQLQHMQQKRLDKKLTMEETDRARSALGLLQMFNDPSVPDYVKQNNLYKFMGLEGGFEKPKTNKKEYVNKATGERKVVDIAKDSPPSGPNWVDPSKYSGPERRKFSVKLVEKDEAGNVKREANVPYWYKDIFKEDNPGNWIEHGTTKEPKSIFEGDPAKASAQIDGLQKHLSRIADENVMTVMLKNMFKNNPELQKVALGAQIPSHMQDIKKKAIKSIQDKIKKLQPLADKFLLDESDPFGLLSLDEDEMP